MIIVLRRSFVVTLILFLLLLLVLFLLLLLWLGQGIAVLPLEELLFWFLRHKSTEGAAK